MHRHPLNLMVLLCIEILDLRQTTASPNRLSWQRPLAINAMTTAGYAGILASPAAIGFVASAVGLHNAFWMLAGLFCLVPLTARFVAGASVDERPQGSMFGI